MSGTEDRPAAPAPRSRPGADGLERAVATGVTRVVVGLADMAAQAVTAARPRSLQPPGGSASLPDAVLGLALAAQRRSVSAALETADRAGRW
ncbi:hypothetical protein ABT288_47160, partial [Streptomyces sp. NPDC001093]|uniref:hypothetical protein n=1 Tax=Streptomyces sp. NPDC001093 TaxID=3154376 RepID=UPI00331ADA06